MERELSDIKIGALCWNQYTEWPALLEAVKLSKASRVLVTHGHAAQLGNFA